MHWPTSANIEELTTKISPMIQQANNSFVKRKPSQMCQMENISTSPIFPRGTIGLNAFPTSSQTVRSKQWAVQSESFLCKARRVFTKVDKNTLLSAHKSTSVHSEARRKWKLFRPQDQRKFFSIEQLDSGNKQVPSPDHKLKWFRNHIQQKTLFGVDSKGDFLCQLEDMSIDSLSILESFVLALSGTKVQRGKSRFLSIRCFIYFSPDFQRLEFFGKKRGSIIEHIVLSKVTSATQVGRMISIQIENSPGECFYFDDLHEAFLYMKAIVCFIPLYATVKGCAEYLPTDKERESYSIMHDEFNGNPLLKYKAVNSNIVLCNSYGQRLAMGNKLAYSMRSNHFCNLRYVSKIQRELLLGSKIEIAVLKCLRHPNIVTCHECLLDKKSGGLFVICEYMARGSLSQPKNQEEIRKDEDLCRNVIQEVILALEHLHSLQIAHGDIRPDTVFLAPNFRVKINALGCLIKGVTKYALASTRVEHRLDYASSAFLAPEQCWLSRVPSICKDGYSSDVWAIGALLYFLFYGRSPFQGPNEHIIQQRICHSKLHIPTTPNISLNARHLLTEILGEKQPGKRVSLGDVKKSRWFQVKRNVEMYPLQRELADLSQSGEKNYIRLSPNMIGNAYKEAKIWTVDGSNRSHRKEQDEDISRFEKEVQ